MPDSTRPLRRSRLGLYVPFILLGLVVGGWSIAWAVIRFRVEAGLDAWLATEAESGRRWACADRAFGGFPFRIEIRCGALSLQRPDVSADLGRLLVVAQVYDPGRVIAEVEGPLRVVAGEITARAEWRLLQASVGSGSNGPERIAATADDLKITASAPAATPVEILVRRFETHLRPHPDRPAVWDWALSSAATQAPGLDVLFGGTEPVDLDLVLAVTQAGDVPARPVWSEVERWRSAGGRADLARLAIRKGARRLEATGSFGIDPQHRPDGRLDLASLGIEGLVGRYTSGAAGLSSGLLGSLLGGPGAGIRQDAPGAAASAGLKPLPPLRLEGGRLYLGPLPVPGVRLPPLY